MEFVPGIETPSICLTDLPVKSINNKNYNRRVCESTCRKY